MADPEIIPLGKDPALKDPSGINPADKSDSSIIIENPDAPVNLGDDIVVVDGVREGDKLEDTNPKPEEKEK